MGETDTALSLSIVIGIFSGVVASSVFLIVLRVLLRPKIAVSDRISAYPSDNGDDRDTYRVKIVNRRYRAVTDVSLAVFAVRMVPVHGGHVRSKKRIGVIYTSHSLPGRRWHDRHHANCLRVRLVADDFEQQICRASADSQIAIEVYGRDSWSGVGRLKRTMYPLGIDSVVHGSFVDGQKIRIADYNGQQPMRLKQLLSSSEIPVGSASR